jgi:hypothetical protein
MPVVTVAPELALLGMEEAVVPAHRAVLEQQPRLAMVAQA